MKLPEENVGAARQDTDTGSHLLEKTPKAQAIKAKVDKWDYIQLRSFCTA